ncbi:MAG TPA: beta-ketoacyl-[acyl-carrier-protein] synthase family protein, partial [Vicinamibacteria bacterium]
PVRVAAEIDRGAPGGGPPGEDPAFGLARKAFLDALANARLEGGEADPRRTGVVVGTVLGGILSGERYLKGDGAGADRLRALARYPLRAIAASLARAAGARGPVLTVSTACASGTDAIGIAFRRIAAGAADRVVAGGVDVLCEFSFSGFCALKALSPDKVRPFSRNRAGLALGEGAAFLVLERETVASRRGAEALGRVAGYASRADGVHLTAPDREGRGLSSAVEAALRDGGCRPGEIDYVNAHGTGTPYNDWMETKALKSALGERARAVPVSSIKGVLGHAFGAAGAMEAAACLLAIGRGVVPPTANFEEPDPECDLDYVPNRARTARVRAALSLSAGFGGQNAALLIRKGGS